MKKFIVTITSIILLFSFSIQTLGETVATPSVASLVISPNTYVINFYLSEDNTSLGNLLFQQKYEIAKDVQLNTPIPIKQGYIFIGWKNDAVKAGVIFNLYKTYPSFSGTPGTMINLYAVFQPNRYTISYHGNGADNDGVYTSNYIYDESYKYSLNSYVKKSYKFLGWNTKQDGSGITVPEGMVDINYSLVGDYIKDNSEFNLYAQWEEIKVATPSNINTNSSTTHPIPIASIQSNTLSSQSTISTKPNNNVYSNYSGITSNVGRLNNENTITQSKILEDPIPENIETPLTGNQDNMLNNGRSRVNRRRDTNIDNNNEVAEDSYYVGIASNIGRLNNENTITQSEILENPIHEDIETPLTNNQDNMLNNGRSRANRRRYTIANNNNIYNQNIDVQEVAENEIANLREAAIVNQNIDSSKNLSSTKSKDVIEVSEKKNNSSNNIFGRFFNWLFKSPVRTVFCLAIFIIAIMIPFIFAILLRIKKKEEAKANEQIHK